MKSVGEAMAIGRTFKEALQKGIRSMEVKRFGFGLDRYDKWLNAGKGTGVARSKSREDDDTASASDKTTQGESLDHEWPIPNAKLTRKLAVPSQGRLYYIRYAMQMGWTIKRIHELTRIDPWFLHQMKQLTDFEQQLFDATPRVTQPWSQEIIDLVRQAKQWGYSDVQLANVWNMSPTEFRELRKHVMKPVYKLVDTCAAEFEATTPYYYSTYELPYHRVSTLSPSSGTPGEGRGGGQPASTEREVGPKGSNLVVDDEIRLTAKEKVIIIGGGPNRIGQGIEFDYCCVQAAFAMKELGYESVMINSNPETVSTDYDTSDLLFFEPLTHEDILNICERLNGAPFNRGLQNRASPDRASPDLVKGLIVQFGGQTPLNLAKGLSQSGVPLLGTSVQSLDAAGDREQFRALLQKLNLKQPPNGIARNSAEARNIAQQIGYPVLVRPSFVLGGRAMEIVSDEEQLNYYMTHAVEAATIADAPILIDKFLDNATEVDVDCLADFSPTQDSALSTQHSAIIIGVMEHIEEAGIHSGDSACALPPYSLSKEIVARLKDQTRALAKALRVNGLMNVQYAIKDNDIYVIEVNPRASRTVPFVSKATGIPWAKIAAKVMAGKTLAELNITEPLDPKHTSVKEVVFPFPKFPGVDILLGPEMRSTGEVMGIDQDFPLAFAKSQIAAGATLPTKGNVFLSVNNNDKPAIIPIAKSLLDCGFTLLASSGTHDALAKAGLPSLSVPKLSEGRPNVKDFIKNGQLQLIINTPTRKGPKADEGTIRTLAVSNRIPIVTTLTGATACSKAIRALQKGGWSVKPLQAYHAK